jgi:multidrug efflux pump subunit AcrA (membrane-fusion protein)
VEVYFDARPDVTAKGKVERIIPKRIEGDSPLYSVYLSLDEIPDGLADGMTVDTNVTITSRPGVLCLPRSVVHASGDNKAVLQVWNGSSTESREVTVGLRGDSNVEIVSGLTEGEKVVVR